MSEFSHIDEHGQAQMVDVSDKDANIREAIATATYFAKEQTIEKIRSHALSKGDVLTVAKIAGINAAKETGRLIPLCHPLSLEHVSISFHFEKDHIVIYCSAKTSSKTGVEMEALCGASIAALTIFDMSKAVDKSAMVGDIFVREKTGGKSGPFTHPTLR